MFEDNKTAEKFVEEMYGLELKYYSEDSVNVSDGETVIDENGKETYHDVKGGAYTVYEFIDSNHVIYQLVYLPDESVGNGRLIEMVKMEESRDVKEWEELKQKVENKNYLMYKLVPFTVQGLPTYS